MSTYVHFIDVGQGNMTLLRLADGKIFLYDCNVTEENEDAVLAHLGKHVGWGKAIDVFVNSHREADHMRGVKKVHEYFPIQHIWDSGVTGTTTNSPEYRDYMDLRLRIGFTEVKRRVRYDYGDTRLRIMNSQNDDLPDEPNAQSIVIKVEHRPAALNKPPSAMLTGDTDAATWKNIRGFYGDRDLASSILLASHHGSVTFFDDPSDQYYYTSHLQAIAPAMTVISVGEDNPHDHPHDKSVEFYDKYSTGSSKGNKIKRTDHHGSVILELKDDGGWNLNSDR